MIKKLDTLHRYAQDRPAGYVADVLSHASAVDEAAGTYTIAPEAWDALKAKYRGSSATPTPAKGHWGPPLWREFHEWARGVGQLTAENHREVCRWMKGYTTRIPCGDCRAECEAWAAEVYGGEKVPLGTDLFAWSVDVHNAVNRKLGKAQLSLYDAMDLYSLAGE